MPLEAGPLGLAKEGPSMNRKQFLKGMAAVVGSLAAPASLRAGGFGAALQEAAAS